ncbi:Serine/threonine-protein kinase AtPK2/AtPK19 [Acorus calamus]|uniref:Serine/threonine-protein kinase AtPK2/AtPK19 n=1 Tax=Acorus calamus TaxID=4465 RepID=A0AAV9CCF6_ACOCL|nr:Serine/threonine-protein kinase AtPK2/AtPK19 [Acorus calamus]
MVSSQISGLHAQKPFLGRLLLPMGPPDVVSIEEEFDFNEVFGPPVQASIEVNVVSPIPALDSNEKVYEDPVVLNRRSHSLVGPSTCISQPLQLSKLTLDEKESPLKLIESDTEEEGESSIADAERKSFDCTDQSTEKRSVGLEDFEAMKLVGQGAFGKVFQVKKKGTSEIYAMKVMRKDKIMEKNHSEYMKAERDILTKIDHPFIVQLRYSFQVMLTDFGLAKQFKENTRSNSMCGTVEYMAPEIVLGKGHDKAADWWSVGILLFEMVTGKLLQKEANKRLGSGPGGSQEIKNHKWFKSINWRKLDAREIQPSFRPNVAGQLCIANFEERWTNMPLQDSPISSPVSADSNFNGFTYVRPSTLLQHYSTSCCIFQC